MVRKFEFKKSYEEIEIAGKVYHLDLDDESLLSHKASMESYGKKMTDLSTKEIPEEEIFGMTKDLAKGLLDELFGQGSYETLYAAAGKSLFNLIDLIEFIGDIVRDKVSEKEKGVQRRHQSHFSSKRKKKK